ncbi:MAG TPA: cytochrome c oxidase subunit II [Bacillales bacterium]|nr:cytochrome c oxidase subunit II [Bacillales bacterium]
MKFWHRYGRFIPLLFTIFLLLAGCSPSAMNPVGKDAKIEGGIMLLSLIIMLFVIFVVMIIFFYVVIRFRKKKDDNTIPEQVEGNTKLEITWTVVPIILLIILVIPMVYQVFFLANDKPKASDKNAISIDVTAHQYWWEFQYDKKNQKKMITTASDLYVPTGTKVYITLNSDDVIHSFWVPSLFGKQDVNPGTTNHMWFEVDKPGIYNGECAELCGPSHALMDFKVIAVKPDQFKKWKSQMRKGEVKPKTALAKQGQKLFKKTCIACHATGNKASQYPNLNNFGNRTTIAGILAHNKENLKAWIKDAPSIKADIDMPNFKNKYTDKQLNALAEYLMEQKRVDVLPAAPPNGRS